MASSAPVAVSSIVMSLDFSFTTVTTLSLPRLVVTRSYVSSTLLPRLTNSLKLSSGGDSPPGSATSTVISLSLPWLSPSSAMTR